jgi:hypothetical protein
MQAKDQLFKEGIKGTRTKVLGGLMHPDDARMNKDLLLKIAEKKRL